MTRGSFARTIVAIALVGLVLRVAYVFLLGAHPALGKDGTWYALQAGTIAGGHGYIDPRAWYGFDGSVPTAQFPPLWPGLLSLVHDLGFTTLRAYRLTGGLVGSLTIVLTGYLGRTLRDDRVGIVAAVVVALSPFMIAADGSLMAESLFIALVTGAVLVAVRARRAPAIGWFALVGLLLGLATLTRSDGLIVTLVLVPVVAWCSGGAVVRRAGLVAVGIGTVLVVLAPWSVRNHDALGELTPLSNNSGSLISGANCRATYSGSRLAGWDTACVPELEGLDETDRAERQRQTGIDFARDEWPRAAMIAPLRAVRGWGLWSPRALLDAEVVESRTRSMQTAGWVFGLVLLGVAAWGAVVMVRDGAEVAVLFAVIGAATLVLVTSWGNQRFRLVAEPELAVLAAVALVRLWSRTRSVNVQAA